VSEQDAKAAQGHREELLLEEIGHGAVGGLDQQVTAVAAQRQPAKLVIAELEAVGQVHLAAGQHLELDPRGVDGALQLRSAIGQLVPHHAGMAGVHVRRGGRAAYPVRREVGGERQALGHCRRPVVDAGQQVAMEVDHRRVR
jgi:hypothetical protein